MFDGHGGVDCACYAVAHFHNNITRQKAFVSDLDEALGEAFLTTDKMFLEKARQEVISNLSMLISFYFLQILKVSNIFQNLRAGTTSVVVMLRDNTLHIGWLGDSQVSMCKQGQAVQLMEPHKPNRKVNTKPLMLKL